MMELTGLSKKTICKYTKHYNDNTRQTSGLGRQCDIRDSPAKRVVEEVRAGVDDDRAPDTEEVMKILERAVEETSGRPKDKISRKWFNRQMERLGLDTKNAQHKSDARKEAERARTKSALCCKNLPA